MPCPTRGGGAGDTRHRNGIIDPRAFAEKKKTGWLCVSGRTPPPQSRRNPIRAGARSSILYIINII